MVPLLKGISKYVSCVFQFNATDAEEAGGYVVVLNDKGYDYASEWGYDKVMARFVKNFNKHFVTEEEDWGAVGHIGNSRLFSVIFSS
jgi:hypothetical protein